MCNKRSQTSIDFSSILTSGLPKILKRRNNTKKKEGKENRKIKTNTPTIVIEISGKIEGVKITESRKIIEEEVGKITGDRKGEEAKKA